MTTATDGLIEIWGVPTPTGVVPFAGNNLAELNATQSSQIFQVVATTPGTTLRWRLRHRGRGGVDVMRVRIGSQAEGTASPIQASTLSDDNTAWGLHTGSYAVPAGQTNTHFGFEAVSSNGGDTTAGNLLDDIFFGTAPCVITAKTMYDSSGAVLANNAKVNKGDVITYRINATNNGGDEAANATIVDTLPAGVTYLAGSLKVLSGPNAGNMSDATDTDQGSVAGATVTVHIGNGATGTAGGSLENATTLAAGTTIEFKAIVASSATGTVTNVATTSFTDLFDNSTQTSTSDDANAVLTSADLSVAVSGTAITPGGTGTQTITVTNNGPDASSGPMTVAYSPPVGAEITALPSGCTGTIPAGPLSCTMTGPIANGANATITVPLRVVASAAPNSTLTGGTVSVTGPVGDPNPTNSSGPVSVGVGAASADISTTVSTPTITPGSTGSAVVTFANAGPSNAPGPFTVVYTPPSGAGIVSMPSGCTGTTPAGPISCSLAGPIAAGAGATLPIPLSMPASTAPGTSLSGGSAATTSPTNDPTPGNNSGTSSVTAGPASADVSVNVTTPNIPPGDTVNANVTASNAGPSDAAGPITFTYTPPTGASIVSLPSGCTGTIPAGPITCNQVGPLAAGATSPVIAIPLTVPASATPGTTLTGGTGSVSTPTADPALSNNNATASAVVSIAAADLVTSSSTPSIVPGGTGNATLTVTNNGPADAAGPISVVYAPPTGASIVSLPTGCTGSIPGGAITCTLTGPIAQGASATVDVPLSIPADAVPGATLAGGTLNATSPTPDPAAANNTSPSDVAVAAGSADLSLTMSNTPVVPGGTGAGTITVSNAGPSNAAGPIVVSYSPPTGVSITALPTGCTGPIPAGPILCSVAGPIAPNASAQFDVPLALAAGASPSTTLAGGAVSVSGPTVDPNMANNTAPATMTTGAASSDVAVGLTLPDLLPGSIGIGVITMSTRGPSHAAGPIAVTFKPPTGLEIAALPTGCTGPIPAGPITCTVPGPIAPGVPVTVNVALKVGSDVQQGATMDGGQVSATSPTTDPSPADNAAPFSVKAAAAPVVVGIAPVDFAPTTAPAASTTAAPATAPASVPSSSTPAAGPQSKAAQASAETRADQPVTVPLIGNGNAEITGKPANGTAALVNGSVQYTPRAGFVGDDVITVTLTAPDGTVTVQRVTVRVLGRVENQAPTAEALAFTGSASSGRLTVVGLVSVVLGFVAMRRSKRSVE